MGILKRKQIPLTGKPKNGLEAIRLKERLKRNRRIRAGPAASKIANKYVEAVGGPIGPVAIGVIGKASLSEAMAQRHRAAKNLTRLRTWVPRLAKLKTKFKSKSKAKQ
ncbi:MAG: hypothetical protein QGI60_04620 [archaeon]|nr:hypothetical protein [archaeon]